MEGWFGDVGWVLEYVGGFVVFKRGDVGNVGDVGLC